MSLADLPRFAAELAECIGEQAMLRLSQAYGGLEIRIPTALADDHELPLQIGTVAARQLVAIYGADVIYVPMLARLRARQRCNDIIQAVQAGQTVQSVARRYATSERNIYRILAAADA